MRDRRRRSFGRLFSLLGLSFLSLGLDSVARDHRLEGLLSLTLSVLAGFEGADRHCVQALVQGECSLDAAPNVPLAFSVESRDGEVLETAILETDEVGVTELCVSVESLDVPPGEGSITVRASLSHLSQTREAAVSIGLPREHILLSSDKIRYRPSQPVDWPIRGATISRGHGAE